MNIHIEAQLQEITMMAQLKMMESIALRLNLPVEFVRYAYECVGDGLRSGLMKVKRDDVRITHFTHECRVALLVRNYFPNDTFGRYLALVHDSKEQAQKGKENLWKKSSSIAGIPGLHKGIACLTEKKPSAKKVAAIAKQIPAGCDPVYFATYRDFIAVLKKNWATVGSTELCDRLDGAYDFRYLEDPRYRHRVQLKALETFARIWATSVLSSESITGRIRLFCRLNFERFNVSERQVDALGKYFES